MSESSEGVIFEVLREREQEVMNEKISHFLTQPELCVQTGGVHA